MRLLRAIRENPRTVLGVAVAVLISWIVADLSKAKGPLPPPNSALRGAELPELVQPIPAQALMPTAHGTLAVSVAVLPKLRPGMTRVEVEDLLGPPTADRVEPVTIANGRMRYRTTYELDDLDPPMTIRPIQFGARILPPPPRHPRSLVALEFDASQPGHPLVEVLYPDPLF
jgi:hypothetical protein